MRIQNKQRLPVDKIGLNQLQFLKERVNKHKLKRTRNKRILGLKKRYILRNGKNGAKLSFKLFVFILLLSQAISILFKRPLTLDNGLQVLVFHQLLEPQNDFSCFLEKRSYCFLIGDIQSEKLSHVMVKQLFCKMRQFLLSYLNQIYICCVHH